MAPPTRIMVYDPSEWEGFIHEWVAGSLKSNTPKVKAACLSAWDKNIANAITSNQTLALTGKFAVYVDAFDFSIFKPISQREIVEQHRATPYFVGRFGGGSPARPVVAAPPDEIHSIYVGHLLAPYEALGAVIGRISDCCRPTMGALEEIKTNLSVARWQAGCGPWWIAREK